MFTTPCFIRKNTPELREKLRELGYTLSLAVADGEPYIYVVKGFAAGYTYLSEVEKYGINCAENEKLFLALAALRDDLDLKQWFINDDTGQWVFCHEPCITWMLGGGAESYHTKATVQELINHFK